MADGTLAGKTNAVLGKTSINGYNAPLAVGV